MMRRDAHPAGLFDTFAHVLDDLWDRATEATP